MPNQNIQNIQNKDMTVPFNKANDNSTITSIKKYFFIDYYLVLYTKFKHKRYFKLSLIDLQIIITEFVYF